jgi:UDP-N-acetylglucosamine transferase subunit ALG13
MIICHAGAGTLTEAIRISSQQKAAASSSTSQTNTTTTTTTKKIVTVINNQLMDNHQTELAYALQRRQLVHVIDDPQSFSHSNNHVWEQIDAFVPSISTTSLEGNPYDVPRIIHQFLGSRSKVETAEKED